MSRPRRRRKTPCSLPTLLSTAGLADVVVTPPPLPQASPAPTTVAAAPPSPGAPVRPESIRMVPPPPPVTVPGSAEVAAVPERPRRGRHAASPATGSAAEPPLGRNQRVFPELVLPDGDVVIVTGPGVIGRAPERHEDHSHVVTLTDPEKRTSRTHLTFGLTDGGRLWVRDEGSANGTSLDGHPLQPWSRVEVTRGSSLRLGAHVVTVR